MNSTTYRRILLIAILILFVPATLLMLCAEPANGQAELPTYQSDTDNADARSDSCAPFLSPQVGIGIGELHGQIGSGRRSDDADSDELSTACVSDSSFAFRVDWIVGGTTIWSLEL